MFYKLFAIALFTLIAIAASARADEFAQHFTASTPTASLPGFVFEDSKGRSLRLADFRGTPILLNLWATWCAPCVEEMPTLDRLQALVGAKQLVIIALDEERNASPDVTAVFFNRHNIRNLAIYNDPAGRATSILHARGLPMTFLIDSEGRDIGTVEGSVDWSAPDAVAFIRRHLLSQPDPTLPD